MERKKLRSARLDKYWTLAEAAEQLEVDINTLSRWEHGKTRPHGYNIVKLCQVYGKTAAELGLDEEQEAPDPAEALLAAPPSRPFLTVLTPDQIANLPQQAEIGAIPTTPGSSTLSESLPHASLPLMPSQQRWSRHFRGVRRGALLLALLAVIGISAGIGYSLAPLFTHGLSQRQQTFSGGKTTTLPSPEQGTVRITVSVTPTRTAAAKPPVSSPGARTATPVSPPGTPGGTPTPVSPHGTPGGTPTPTATPVPDCLNGSVSNLKFTSVLGLGNVSPSVLTLTNCGGPTQNWFASAATTSGGNWLNAYPSMGTIAANERESVQIQAAATGLQIGTYHGSITFTKGSSFWVVTVTFTIIQL